jgi:hypothetical protein
VEGVVEKPEIMAMSNNAPEASRTNPLHAAQSPAHGNWTHFALLVCSLLATVQCLGVGMGAVRPFVAIEDHRALVLFIGTVTGLAGGASIYIFATHVLGRSKPPRLFRLSAALLLVFVAFEMGTITTLIAFGQSSPWGYVVEGISGPLFGWLDGVVSPAWWTLPFIIGFFGTIGVLAHLWENAKASGFLTSEGLRT